MSAEKHLDDHAAEWTPILRTKIELAVKRYQAARTAYYEAHGAENERRAFRDAAEDLERAEWVEVLLERVKFCEQEMQIRGECATGLIAWIKAYTDALDSGMAERAKSILKDGRELLIAAFEEEVDEQWNIENERGLSG